MIKVLLLGPSFILKGGVTNYLDLLIQNLKKEEVQVKYFAHGIIPKIWINIFLPFIVMIQLIKLKKILKTYQPDVVHINPSLVLGAIIRDFLFLTVVKENGNQVLFFIHGWRKIISGRFEKHGFWRKYFKKRFDMADVIVVLTKKFKEHLVNLGVDQNKIYVSSMMVDSNKYHPNSKEFIRPYEILFCANLRREKGPYELLDAVPLVLSKYGDTKFTFVGKGKDLDKLKEIVKEKGLGKNVVFTGYKNGYEKINIYKKAHIFAFPSYTEGFPNVILEAMAAGCALVFTPVGSLAEAMVDGKNGLIVKAMPPNPEEIAEKIMQLIENPNIMKKMSQNNLVEAKEKYDIKVVSKQIREIYHNIDKKNTNF